MYEYIENNLRATLDEIETLSAARGGKVRLVAVTKSGTDEELLALVRSGAAEIGENRPQELRRRGELLAAEGLSPALHEIGHLQRNKVKYIIERVSLIHSVDNIELAREIDRQAAKVGRRVPVLIEVNSAREEAKSGALPEEVEALFLAVREMPNLMVSGLMTMGPVVENPEDIRPYFALTRELYDALGKKYGFEGEPTLSMGMSDSYKIAIEEGATLVRIGRRLFLK